MKPDQYISLIHKELTRQLSSAEAADLVAWLEEDDQHRQFREEIRHSWELAGSSLSPVATDEIEQELGRLKQRLSHATPKTDNVHYSRRTFYAIAASFLLMTITAWGLWHWQDVDRSDTERITYAKLSEDEGVQEMLLPDNSTVSMRSLSTLSYEERGGKREVSLSGQAFFHVSPDAQHPFLVFVNGMIVKVLGTSFFVKGVTGEPLEVSVASGVVEVAHGKQRFQLKKGELLLIPPGEEPRLQLNRDPNYFSWYSQKLVFLKTPLREVLPALERHYGVSITAAVPEILHCRFTGTFEDVPLDELLEIISYSLSLSVEKLENRKLSLSGKGCH